MGDIDSSERVVLERRVRMIFSKFVDSSGIDCSIEQVDFGVQKEEHRVSVFYLENNGKGPVKRKFYFPVSMLYRLSGEYEGLRWEQYLRLQRINEEREGLIA